MSKQKIWTDMHSWRLFFKQLKFVVRVPKKIWEKTQHLIYKKENKSCDNFNWMSYIKFNIYNCKPVLRTYISLAGFFSSTSLKGWSEGHYDRSLTQSNIQSLPKNQKYQAWLELKPDPSRSRFKSKQKTSQKLSISSTH